jgi:hypothetical protein
MKLGRVRSYYTTRDSKGKTTTHSRRVFDHWESRTRWHGPTWTANSNIDTDYGIGEQRYLYFVKMFGNQSSKRGDRRTMEHNSRMIAGDPMDYYTTCPNDFVEPITDVRWFENRIKATPSVFNFVDVPPEVPVFEYPANRNPWQSNRVMGSASRTISIRLWDEMCARLGVRRYVNMIIIEFDSSDSMLAEWQKSKWWGGKKNDLVLCVGKGFTKVFGWSESDVCKRNLETLLLKHPLDNTILPLIEQEVMANYKKREFTEDFAYLSVEPQAHHWWTFIILLILTQTGLYIFFHKERIFY